MGIKKGFTFIEMVVVIAVIGLALPALFSIFFIILQQEVKINRLSQVKREGDYALNVMENVIKSYGSSIYSDSSLTTAAEICNITMNSSPNDGSAFYFKDKSGNMFNFSLTSNNAISSASAILTSELILSSNTDLTSDKVKVTNFLISCSRSATYSTPVVNVSFTIEYNSISTTTRPEETASFNYQASIKLKNY